MIGFCIVCPRLASLWREILTGFFSEITAEISITRASRDLQRGDNIPIGLDRRCRARDAQKAKDPTLEERNLSEVASERRMYDLPANQDRPVADAQGTEAVIVEQS
jgi:hypothetical protein